MTSTPVSLNDSSLNGSWIDINSASQIPSQMDNDGTPEFLLPPYSSAESMQNLGLISFQVERFLQEAAQQRNQQSQSGLLREQTSGVQDNDTSNLNDTQQQSKANYPTDACDGGDDNSGIYVSESETSLDGFNSEQLIKSLKRIQQGEGNNKTNDLQFKKQHHYLVDQLSDSLSLLSRASAIGDPTIDQTNFQDFDWLWDWTAQPEYFTGQEWKVYAPKQDYLMRQRQLYQSHGSNPFSGDVVSLLFLTNFLSIIIGAGLTYSIMMRRSSV